MKTSVRLNITLPPTIAAWLNKNITNKSAYIAHLIQKDAKLEPDFKKQERASEK